MATSGKSKCNLKIMHSTKIAKVKESLCRDFEKKYKSCGKYKYVLGIDEAGRGPLAGPVVAASCI